jgi:serine/threonine protein kinase
MGEVYRARDPVLKRDVAIKVLPSFVSQDPDRLRRFEQEAQAAAVLNHPNILAVHQFGAFGGAPYLVSELLEGDTLRQQLLYGPLPVPGEFSIWRHFPSIPSFGERSIFNEANELTPIQSTGVFHPTS